MKGINKTKLAIAISLLNVSWLAHAIEFNTDVLNAEDKQNIDLKRFTQANYVMPGEYLMAVNINKYVVPEQPMHFYAREGQPDSSEPCLSPALMEQLGLKEDALAKVRYWHDGQCAELASVEGMAAKPDLASGTLYLSIPQAWLEYSDANWLPPSRWDNGIAGMLLDYNINTLVSKPNGGRSTQNTSLNGTTGFNLGPWRARADFQGNNARGGATENNSQFDWSRVYLYRAIPRLASTLMLGESFFTSDIFDSFRYTGISMATDERMLPPNLRGYAPEVAGIARTNAKVTVSQQGRVIYQTTVASGPFRIQDLNSSVNGRLDVKIEEQDGTQQSFQVDTATIPYLTRPGTLRYKTAVGQPSDFNHNTEGPVFASGEASWGVSNSWSLYGGAIASNSYNALSMGLGRDLFALGAVSADITQSFASDLPDRGSYSGKSYRVSYAKRFDKLDSEITFAGYRFSERNYMTMSQYINSRYHGGTLANDKAMYTITANKNFQDARIGLYLNYSHQTYWDQRTSDYYSIAGSRYFDAFSMKDFSINLTASRTQNEGKNDNAVYLSLSVPLGNAQTLSYNAQRNGQGNTSQTVNYLNNSATDTTYRLSTGINTGNDDGVRSQFSGFYSRNTPLADINVNASYMQNSFTSAGLSVQGGATVTGKGAALHPLGASGGTRLMVDTDGIAGVPIEGGRARSNAFGIAVINDMQSYYRIDTRIDISKLDDNVEATRSVVESALTEGAIGYRRFGMLKGEKIMATLGLANGGHPPFGSSIVNQAGKELAIVSDAGFAYLAGVQPGERLDAIWNGSKQCQVVIPEKLVVQSQLLLPCRPPQ
ncbi:TPA: fimbria/pilus outer membrane usher protein [Serratia fonticola]